MLRAQSLAIFRCDLRIKLSTEECEGMVEDEVGVGKVRNL